MWATYICQARIHSRLVAASRLPRLDDRAVDVTRQITGNEDEEFGRVAEAVVSHRQPGHDVVRDVIEENHPQTEAAKEIEPKVAFDRFRE